MKTFLWSALLVTWAVIGARCAAPTVDREAWIVYECNDLAMIAFVKTDDSIEGVGIATADDVKTTLERAHQIPVQRRYYIAVARYCPYTKRRT